MEYTQEQLVQMAAMLEWMVENSARVEDRGFGEFRYFITTPVRFGEYRSQTYKSPQEALTGEMANG